ncbi:MAG: PIG-L family deacetylase [Burkholderiaceae bacterium]|nr:PIG-L family deacetylase [Burkholderiaceae bacterium]
MLRIDPGSGRPLRLLCIGAHCDDIEIGCGGTLLEWLGRRPLEVDWVVLSAHAERAAEARRSAAALLRRASRKSIALHPFRDGHFPAQFEALKGVFADLGSVHSPDLVLTHTLDDRHQDHRLAAELAWQTFRRQPILEFEIAKYEGDLGKPNVFVPLAATTARRKIDHLLRFFPSQHAKDWFRAETFAALMHLRAIECRADGGSAEAFVARKLVLDAPRDERGADRRAPRARGLPSPAGLPKKRGDATVSDNTAKG